MKKVFLALLAILAITFYNCTNDTIDNKQSTNTVENVNYNNSETARLVAYDTVGLSFTSDSLAVFDGDYVVDTWNPVDYESETYHDIYNLIQNSSCATCKTLHCKAYRKVSGGWLVTCEDGVNYFAYLDNSNHWQLMVNTPSGTSSNYFYIVPKD